MRTTRLIRSLLVVSLLVCFSAATASAAESETHLLDETLSLQGGCFKDDKLDKVEDPGCPGGAHPPAPFANPVSVTTDPHGNIYVASAGPVEKGIIDPDGGRIDVFDSTGHYLTGLKLPGVRVIAVDASGHLYAAAECFAPEACAKGSPGVNLFLRFDPIAPYVPAAGEISYDDEDPVALPVQPGPSNVITGLAVNPTNQHVFAGYVSEILEFGPAVPGEPNVKLEEGIGVPVLAGEGGAAGSSASVAVDAAHGLLYATDNKGPDVMVVQVFELAAPHGLIRTIDGSETPQGVMKSTIWGFGIAPDEATGQVFVADFTSRVLHEFEEDGSYVGSFEHSFVAEFSYLRVDNSSESPNQGYLFVPSGRVPGHLYAYQPAPTAQPPVVETVSAGGVGQREAVLSASVNPEGSATHYTFEYTTQEAFDAEEFAGALIVGEGDLASGISDVAVSAPATGLSPGTAYRFRVRAESECEPGEPICIDEGEGSFATFPAPLQGGSCGNAALRSGPSAGLPDCRAYELVTPPDTSGHPPLAPVSEFGSLFGTPPMSAAGDAVSFRIVGGPIPGTPGFGGPMGDAYLATRTPSGWQEAIQSPTGEQAPLAGPGGLSPDLRYIAWRFSGTSAGIADYIRHPDGSFHLVGEGTLTDDPEPRHIYIGPDGSHVIFASGAKLVDGAPDAGTSAIYDRTADGVLHVASLLPGDVIPGAGAAFQGHSDDGSRVAFTLGASSPLYVRVDNAETLTASPPGAAFAGFGEDGDSLFYVSAGDFYRFDVQTGENAEIAASGDAEPVNVPSSGSGAYFLSPSKLTSEPNPNGAEAIEGQPNLYYWDGAQTRFVATVTAEDVKGEFNPIGGTGNFLGGFEEWMDRVRLAAFGINPMRSSEQGSTLLFRSRAQLTPYDSEGHAQIYRYDAGEGALSCVSCNPTQSAPGSDAKLTSFGGAFINRFTQIPNLSADGRRAFFETSDRLVPADNDGLQDVYEWEAEGKGSCRQPGGCLFLISPGQSGRPSFLAGASASGDDVLFSTSDLLTSADRDETPSLYDARVGGGFAAAMGSAGECLGEACQPAAIPPPLVAPASSLFQGAGNVRDTARCRKGTQPKRVRGKTRCVKKSGKKSRKTRSHRPGRSAR
jgi:hypothetical protein